MAAFQKDESKTVGRIHSVTLHARPGMRLSRALLPAMACLLLGHAPWFWPQWVTASPGSELRVYIDEHTWMPGMTEVLRQAIARTPGVVLAGASTSQKDRGANVLGLWDVLWTVTSVRAAAAAPAKRRRHYARVPYTAWALCCTGLPGGSGGRSL